MIKVINIILALLCVALAYFLYQSINNPVKYQAEIEKRNQAVHQQLYSIRDAQEAFKSINGVYAENFDTLKTVLKTGQYVAINKFSNDTIRVNVLDSLYKGDVSKITNLDKVPFSKNATFEIGAGILDSPSDSTVKVPVFEAKTYTDKFLEGVNKDYWRKGKRVKIGSLTAPILTGNWE